MKSRGIKLVIVNVGIGLVLTTPMRADETIRSIQQALKDQGVYYGSVTGEKNAETAAAIRRYQIRNGLQVTGELNPETLSALKNPNSTAPTHITSKPVPSQTKAAPAKQAEAVSSDSPYPQTEPSRQLDTSSGWSAAYYQSVPRGVDTGMIAEAQRQLLMRGYYRGRIDGRRGRSTTAAVRAFQMSAALPLTGQLDASTLNALGLSNDNLDSLSASLRSSAEWVPVTKFKHGKWKVKWRKYRHDDAEQYADERRPENEDASLDTASGDYYNR